jgi:hypothetical protein
MTRLDDYRFALLATFADVSDAELAAALESGGPDFVSFIVDHGLGPLWHERTGRGEFHESRLSAEALYIAQEHALKEIDEVLEAAGIEYAVIKGAASRLLLYANPANRACYDIDILVRLKDRVRAATVLVEEGFVAVADARNISRELTLSRGAVDIDLHWGLLREGRLRFDPTTEMLTRRRRCKNIWMLCPEDSLFLFLVHPAFSKHLAGWGMGLHRVADIALWFDSQNFDRQAVCEQLESNGVRAAAWATLRWVELLTEAYSPRGLDAMQAQICPGRLRSAWLDRWLRADLAERTSGAHWARLLGFSLFLHDTPADAMRALAGRRQAHRRSNADLDAFCELLD